MLQVSMLLFLCLLKSIVKDTLQMMDPTMNPYLAIGSNALRLKVANIVSLFAKRPSPLIGWSLLPLTTLSVIFGSH